MPVCSVLTQWQSVGLIPAGCRPLLVRSSYSTLRAMEHFAFCSLLYVFLLYLQLVIQVVSLLMMQVMMLLHDYQMSDIQQMMNIQSMQCIIRGSSGQCVHRLDRVNLEIQYSQGSIQLASQMRGFSSSTYRQVVLLSCRSRSTRSSYQSQQSQESRNLLSKIHLYTHLLFI